MRCHIEMIRELRPRATALTFAVLLQALMIVRASDAAVVKLSGGAQLGPVHGFDVSSDSARVVFKQGFVVEDEWGDFHDHFDLYSTSVAGGTPVKLNVPLGTTESVDSFDVSPDGTRVVYSIYDDDLYEGRTYSVPIAGPSQSSVLMHPPAVSAYRFRISPNSAHVVLEGEELVSPTYQQVLYSVPLAGGAAVKLYPPLLGGGQLWYSQFSPDSNRVLYTADQDKNNQYELYSQAVDGSDRKLLYPLVPGAGSFYYFLSTPDSSRIVYLAAQESAKYDMFRMLIGGGPSTKLNQPLGSQHWLDSVRITQDSNRVVYRLDDDALDFHELYTVPVDGGTRSKLSGSVSLAGDDYDLAVSLDSTSAVFRAQWNETDGEALYRVPLSGGPPVKIAGQAAWNTIRITPDSRGVVFSSAEEDPQHFQLFAAPLGGGSKQRLSADGEDALAAAITADSRTVLYWGGDLAASELQLYQVSPSGGQPSPIEVGLIPGGSIGSVWPTPDSAKAVFSADAEVVDVPELYAVELVLFQDGFDGGGLDRWSATVPPA